MSQTEFKWSLDWSDLSLWVKVGWNADERRLPMGFFDALVLFALLSWNEVIIFFKVWPYLIAQSFLYYPFQTKLNAHLNLKLSHFPFD